MRTIVLVIVASIPFIGAAPLSATAGCTAPYAGCLAACGSRVTQHQPPPIKAECRAKCQVALKSCECRAARKACLAKFPPYRCSRYQC